MKSNTGIVSLVLLLMAASSLISMISILKIDGMVHGDLYRYGLQFSPSWAIPYWTMTTIVFAMGWFNIIASVAFQFYMLIYGREKTFRSEISEKPQLQPKPKKEEIIGMIEIKPAEKVEESKEQAAEPAEKVEKEPVETQTVVEDKSRREKSETIQAAEVEEQKEQGSKTAEESKTETKETSTPATETEQEAPEKSEEAPILAGVPEEEPQTAAEETPQQIGTSPL